jgi:hypothetical protein
VTIVSNLSATAGSTPKVIGIGFGPCGGLFPRLVPRCQRVRQAGELRGVATRSSGRDRKGSHLHDPLMPTMQGLGQHEPLVWLNLHRHSL